jgi:hypothetical protein
MKTKKLIRRLAPKGAHIHIEYEGVDYILAYVRGKRYECWLRSTAWENVPEGSEAYWAYEIREGRCHTSPLIEEGTV